ncbi:YceK/YidQ family lipoprotein [Pseudomonas paralactis]|uniref:YceK/YidQ family lipoprotein n=1 Tax=Pseudomonas paralactis TaxID=1615673 RepID=UPI00164906D0|nr:YceK/YidQ family lipoprotein [Pseudomonas paralactis]MBC3255356.1 YceK/YidQ family lipoprotein [Pseudomonas paralactis]
MWMPVLRLLVLLGVSLAMGGCGTGTTVLRGDDVTVLELNRTKTYCKSVPRVYSGLVYDLCVLHGPPNSASGLSLNGIPWVILDAPVSAVLDTLVLPYTIYRQSADGSIELR